MSAGNYRLDIEVEKIAVRIALDNKFRHVSLRRVAEESSISIEEVSRILSISKIGEIETYNTDTLGDDVFILTVPPWFLKELDKQPSKSQTSESFSDSQDSTSKADQGKEKGGAGVELSLGDWTPLSPRKFGKSI